jgi:hypothetical protein
MVTDKFDGDIVFTSYQNILLVPNEHLSQILCSNKIFPSFQAWLWFLRMLEQLTAAASLDIVERALHVQE